jgi:hypothetical protein
MYDHKAFIMTAPTPAGLLAIWADVDQAYHTEYKQWHNCEHIPERVRIAGFHAGHRYRALDDAREFFMVYETDDANVMQSDAYLHSQNNPTPWTRKSIGHFQRTLRTIYHMVVCIGNAPELVAPYVLLVRSNPPEKPNGSEEVIRWYRDEHLIRLCALEGVLRGRLYQADSAISSIVTAEREVHGASSGHQEFLAMYELTNADLPQSPAWREAATGTAWSARMVRSLRDLERERYWLDFSLWAPGRR